MRKRINLITSAPLSEPVVSNRLFPFFEALSKLGFAVHCICPASDFDHTLLPENVVLKEIDLHLTKPSGFVRRAMCEARDVWQLLRFAKTLDSDATLVTIPSMFLAFLTPLRLRRQKIFIDIRDLTWEYLPDSQLCFRFAKRFCRGLFRNMVRRFSLVSVTNDTEFRYVQPYAKVTPLHISNGIRQAQFNRLKHVENGAKEIFTVTYVGNVGLAQRLDTLVAAAKKLPEIQFKIVGSGIELPKIRELVKEQNLENITLTGRIPWDEVMHQYSSSHVLYAQLAPEFSGAMPSKLYEYLATGKPIIYGGQGQALEVLQPFENYHVVSPCEPSLLADKIQELSDSLDRSRLSDKNKKLISENYIREKVAEELAEAIRGRVLGVS